jgi:hypothetical protein
VHLIRFIIKEFITMPGHTNVKKKRKFCNICCCFSSALCVCLMFYIGESVISSMIYGTLYVRKGKDIVHPRTGHEGPKVE